jgi:hypothetical protein
MKAKKQKRPKLRKGEIGRRIIKVCLIIVGVCIFSSTVCSLVSALGYYANMKLAKSLSPVQKDEVLVPFIDEETGYWTFETDDDFKILQLTDTHFGAGFLSLKTDQWAINAITDMLNYVKPDLVLITGDMIYSDFFRTGNINNMTASILFAQTMESLGIYWAVTFGNHDSDVYALYDRNEISDFYEKSGFKYCIYMRGPTDIFGCSNYFINVKRTDGIISQSIVLLDSNSYKTGFRTNYDNIHDDQIEWYKNEIIRLDGLNKKIDPMAEQLKSIMFFHIPLYEYRTAWYEYINDNDTPNVKYNYGVAGETGKIVYSSNSDDNVFETIQELGSTKAVFTGHDHLNNFSIDYNGGEGTNFVRLTYSLSIDYNAYVGIYKKTAQRGGTVITTKRNGEYEAYGLRMVDHQKI